MKRDTDQDFANLEDKIDFLTEIVQQLRLEVLSLKDELHLKREKSVRKKEKDSDINSTPIVEGDICIVLNKYKGLQGTKFKVTSVNGDKIHFWHNGYPTWRIRTNVKKIAHGTDK